MYVPQPWCRRCIREGVGGGEVRKGVWNGGGGGPYVREVMEETGGSGAGGGGFRSRGGRSGRYKWEGGVGEVAGVERGQKSGNQSGQMWV